MRGCDNLIDASSWSITEDRVVEEARFDDGRLETRGANWWTALGGELVSDNLLEDELGGTGKWRVVKRRQPSVDSEAFADSIKLFTLPEMSGTVMRFRPGSSALTGFSGYSVVLQDAIFFAVICVPDVRYDERGLVRRVTSRRREIPDAERETRLFFLFADN